MPTVLLFINPRNRGQQADGFLRTLSRPVPCPAGVWKLPRKLGRDASVLLTRR